MIELAVVIMRGGTSKGVFCRLGDLPAGDADRRQAFLLALMGSPDPMQLDGLGGTHSSTSKVVAVGRSPEPGVDVDYLFAQVGVDRAVVDLAGNCGNLTAAVGPYAVDEGLVPRPDAEATSTVVMLRNLNTGVRIRAAVPLDGGRAAWRGDVAIDGVPGTGAPVVTEYLDPAGSVTGKLLPTGSPRDHLDGLDVSVVDVASPHAFVRAADLGLSGDEAPAELNTRVELLARLERLRSACGRAVGVDSAAIPRLVLVSPPTDPSSADVRVRATSMQVVHHATPITAALCTAAALVVPDTVAHATARPTAGRGGVVGIEHPKGRVEATVELDEAGQVRATGVVRTARRLLSGVAYVPVPG